MKTKVDPIRLTMDMVAIPSYSFMENQEEAISQYILDFFLEHGFTAYRTEIVPGRYNTVAILEGTERETSPSLMLTGHMDTVPAYDFEKAFEPWEDAENVYGRGTVDMKGALAAAMCAMVEIKESGTRLKGDLIFCGVADEEEAGIGTRSLIETGPEATYTVVGEPTDLHIALGHKGLEWIEVTFKGKKVHGGAQEEGVNAIMMAGRFLQKLETEYLPKLAQRTHPILGKATLNIGTITGGDQPSTVADHCSIRLDRRCLTSETIAQVYEELQELIDQLHREDPRFEAEIRDVFDGTTLPHIPFCTDADCPVVKAAENALRACGEEPVVTYFPAWTDAGFIQAGTSSQCIILGPGGVATAHSVHEYISKKQLRMAAEIYRSMAMEICQVDE
ncbi:MAG: M20 family metallopeptidase [Anaerovoracaceae bacterium]|nr:M20 family metallopeptidase [Anaerovoracaceae bacterium]